MQEIHRGILLCVSNWDSAQCHKVTRLDRHWQRGRIGDLLEPKQNIRKQQATVTSGSLRSSSSRWVYFERRRAAGPDRLLSSNRKFKIHVEAALDSVTLTPRGTSQTVRLKLAAMCKRQRRVVHGHPTEGCPRWIKDAQVSRRQTKTSPRRL